MEEVSRAQKALWYFMLFLIALMLFFSLFALKDKGKGGYERCMAEKCAAKGEEFCGKYRERSNCCQGAGGTINANNQPYECVFS